MCSKGFVCEVDLSLHLVSSIGNYECPENLVYLSVEVFGTVHKTRPQRSYYPLLFNEIINFQKTFWSPSSEEEVLEALEDVPIVIELRKLDPCFYQGLLLAYYDGNARDFLFGRFPRIPCSINGQEIYMDRTVDCKGTAPKLRYSVFSDIKPLGSSFDAGSRESKLSNTANRYDDGYHSPTHSVNYERQSRSRNRSPSPTPSEKRGSSPAYYTRQTVASALRSRSPSPALKSFVDKWEDSGISDEYDSKAGRPFVVRKVPDDIISRNPSFHDHPIRSGRRGRNRRRSPVKAKIGRSQSLIGSREALRETSPTRKSALLDAYKPSTIASGLRRTTALDLPHYCHNCYYHSPLLDYYSDRLHRLTCSTSHSHPYRCCYSHGSCHYCCV